MRWPRRTPFSTACWIFPGWSRARWKPGYGISRSHRCWKPWRASSACSPACADCAWTGCPRGPWCAATKRCCGASCRTSCPTRCVTPRPDASCWAAGAPTADCASKCTTPGRVFPRRVSRKYSRNSGAWTTAWPTIAGPAWGWPSWSASRACWGIAWACVRPWVAAAASASWCRWETVARWSPPWSKPPGPTTIRTCATARSGASTTIRASARPVVRCCNVGPARCNWLRAQARRWRPRNRARRRVCCCWTCAWATSPGPSCIRNWWNAGAANPS